MGRLATFAPADSDEALAFISARPYDNVYVSWLLATGQIGRRDDVMLWREDDGSLGGVGYLCERMIPIADGDDAIAAFAGHTARTVSEPRMIVGTKSMVDRFWTSLSPRFSKPFAIRERQPVYVVDRARLRGSRADLPVVRTRIEDVDEIAHHSARMTAGELGTPVVVDAAFRKRTANIVQARWSWHARVDGNLVFVCNVGSATPYTAQIQGVWTPPEMRGKGYASLALGAICDLLLDEHPTLSLYVNSFNTDAIALYERLGFEAVSAFSTILF